MAESVSAHPGFLDYTKGIEVIRQQREARKFSDFAPFIHMSQKDPIINRQFSAFLEQLFQKTKDDWEPAQCRSTPGMQQIANQIARECFLSEVEVVAQRFLHGHFWLELRNLQETLIVDPSGVPFTAESRGSRTSIIPFFGPLSESGEFARKIYSQGQDMDDWGTRELPKGFHP